MKVKLLSHSAKVPQRTNDFAAGYDCYIPTDVIVHPGRNVIPLDFAVELDPHTEGQIRPRSGFSAKGMEGVDPYSSEAQPKPKRYDADVIIGTIDEDYRGNVGVIIKSYEHVPFMLKQGTKVCQLVVSHYIGLPFERASDLSNSERGEQGFGHTGVK